MGFFLMRGWKALSGADGTESARSSSTSLAPLTKTEAYQTFMLIRVMMRCLNFYIPKVSVADVRLSRFCHLISCAPLNIGK